MASDVSVVIPTFNRKNTVARAIDSVLAQDLRPKEVIVVDDGSTDGSSDMLAERYGEQIELLVQRNAGVSAARNRGVLASSGELVAFLDSDDVWEPTKLAEQALALERSGSVLCYTNYGYLDREAGDRFAEIGLDLPSDCEVFERPMELLTRWGQSGMHLCGTLCRRQPLLDVGMFDVRLRIAEDTKFFLSMARRGSFTILRKPLWLRMQVSDGVQLTKPQDEAYQREHTSVVLDILGDCLASEPRENAGARGNLRRLLAYFSMKRARFLLIDRCFPDARRSAMASMGYSLSGRAALYSALIALAPALTRRLLVRRLSARRAG